MEPNFSLGDPCQKCGKPVCEKISDWNSYLDCPIWCHCGDNMFKSTNAEGTYPTDVNCGASDVKLFTIDYSSGCAAVIGDFKVTYNP